MDGFRLQVAFMDGTEGVADLSRLIHAPNAGIFATLSNPDVFSAAYLEHGNIVWETGADLAPDAMHQAIATTGVWIP
jgi:hypothetical protein